MKTFANLKLIFILVISFSCNNSSSIQKQKQDTSSKTQNIGSEIYIQQYVQGKLIFEKHCATCHTPPDVYRTDQFIFDDLFQHLPSPSEDYFITFITNSKVLEDSGDKRQLELKEVFNSKYNHQFKNSITQNEFPSLIYYIKEAPLIKK